MRISILVLQTRLWLAGVAAFSAAAVSAAPAFRVTSGSYTCISSSCPVYNFGVVPDAGSSVSFTITNIGNAKANSFTQVLSGSQVPSVFSVTSDSCGTSLAKNAACSMTIRLLPPSGDAGGTAYGNDLNKVKLVLAAASTPTVTQGYMGTKAVPPVSEPFAIDNTTLDASYSDNSGGNPSSNVKRIVSRDNGDAMAAWMEKAAGGTTGRLMSSLYDSATQSFGAPVLVAAVPGSFRFDLATDGTNYIIAWQEDVGSIHYIKASRWENGVWSAPQRFDTTGSAHYATVRMHSSGKAILFFEDLDVFKVARFDGANWLPTQVVGSDASGTVTSGLDGAFYSDGSFVLVWPQIGYLKLFARHFIWDLSPHWAGNQIELTQPGSTYISSRLQLELNSSGQGMAVWGGNNTSHTRRFSPDTGFAPEEIPDNGSVGINLGVDDDGNVMILYAMDDPATSSTVRDAFVKRNVWNGSAYVWEAGVKIENDDSGTIFDPAGEYNYMPLQLSVSGSGMATAAWHQKNASNVNSIYTAEFDGSSWSAPVQVDSSQAANNSLYPHLSRKVDGDSSFISWTQWDGARWNMHAKRLD